ncbi:MAG: AsmA family protein [Proteobacteria bacterium]|nr:AsmA family protein [Pseudomonadota bacterium]MBU1685971.1 AsmA family protein [Pseudomonadota bacterium]
MKKRLIILTILTLSCLLLYGSFSTSLKQMFPKERLVELLIAPAEKKLGTTIEVGTVEVSLFVGISFSDIIIKHKGAENTFISIKNLTIHPDLFALFKKKLVIKEIQLTETHVAITKDQSGHFNIKRPDPSEQNTDAEIDEFPQSDYPPLPIEMVSPRIILTKANITFSDQNGELPSVTESQLDLDLIANFDPAFELLNFHGTFNTIINSSYLDKNPVFIIQGDLSEKNITFLGNLSIDFEQTSFNGKLINVTTEPSLRLNLRLGTVDLKALSQIKLPSFDIPAEIQSKKPSQRKKQASLAQKFQALGEISISNLTGHGLAMSGVNFFYQYEKDTLEVKRFKANSVGGTLTGETKTTFSSDVPVFQGTIKATELEIVSILEKTKLDVGLISGKLTAELAFTSQGKDWVEIKDRLNLSGYVTANRGGLRTPTTEKVGVFLNLPEIQNLEYEVFSSTIQMTDGKMALNYSFDSDALAFSGNGEARLNGNINLPFDVTLAPEYSARLKTQDAFASYPMNQDGRMTLPLRITGSPNKPSVGFNNDPAKKARPIPNQQKTSEGVPSGLSDSGQRIDTRTDTNSPEALKDLSDQLIKALTQE